MCASLKYVEKEPDANGDEVDSTGADLMTFSSEVLLGSISEARITCAIR